MAPRGSNTGPLLSRWGARRFPRPTSFSMKDPGNRGQKHARAAVTQILLVWPRSTPLCSAGCPADTFKGGEHAVPLTLLSKHTNRTWTDHSFLLLSQCVSRTQPARHAAGTAAQPRKSPGRCAAGDKLLFSGPRVLLMALMQSEPRRANYFR